MEMYNMVGLSEATFMLRYLFFFVTKEMRKAIFCPLLCSRKKLRRAFALHLGFLLKRAAQLKFLCSSIR